VRRAERPVPIGVNGVNANHARAQNSNAKNKRQSDISQAISFSQIREDRRKVVPTKAPSLFLHTTRLKFVFAQSRTAAINKKMICPSVCEKKKVSVVDVHDHQQCSSCMTNYQ
jgi:hypothetical protein